VFRNSKYWTNEIGEFVRLRIFFVVFFKKRNVILNVSLFLFFSSFEVLRMKSVSSSDFEASFLIVFWKKRFINASIFLGSGILKSWTNEIGRFVRLRKKIFFFKFFFIFLGCRTWNESGLGYECGEGVFFILLRNGNVSLIFFCRGRWLVDETGLLVNSEFRQVLFL